MFRKTMEEYEADTRKKLVIDIREKEAFDKETMPGALHMDSETLKQQIKELTKDQTPVYLLCHTGQQSDALAEDFEKEGYEVYSIQDGFRAYLRLKLRTVMRQEDLKEQCCADVERSIVKKFRKEIWRPFTKAINEYELIKDGDKIAVCISGGKDSMLMAKLFQELKRHGQQNFEVVYLVMNPGYNPFNYQVILDNAQFLNVPITVFESEIFDIVASEEQSPCYLCARMRRGYLYSKAKELGCVNTHFVNPHGLHNKKHYTCAHDMALIAQAAFQIPLFRKITKTVEYKIPKTKKKKEDRWLVNHQKMLYEDGEFTYKDCEGGKTGFTAEAGYCYVGSLRRDERTFIVALLACGWPDNKGYKWKDTRKLMEYGL